MVITPNVTYTPADGFSGNDTFTFAATDGTVQSPDATETIVVNAACDPALNEKAKFKLSIDGKLIDKETTLTSDDPKDYSFTTPLKAGERKLKIEFTNDAYKENEYDRNLYVHEVKVRPAAKKPEKKDKN